MAKRIKGYGKYSRQKPYLLEGGNIHYLTGTEERSNYWQCLYTANKARFSAPIKQNEQEAVPTVVEEPIAPVITSKKKKNIAATIIAFVAAVLFVALAVLSYFKIYSNYLNFFVGVNTKDFYDLALNIVKNPKAYSMFGHAFVGVAFLTAYLAFISLIVGFVAVVSNNKVRGVGILALLALVTWLACGALCFFDLGIAKDGSAAIINFVNPLEMNGGALLGYYIATALLLIETICGFTSYAKRK